MNSVASHRMDRRTAIKWMMTAAASMAALDSVSSGAVPSTKAEDGDPLDVLIVHDAATYPGLVLKCKPIGVLEVVQSSKDGSERNDRVFVVPDRSPFEGDLQDIRRLPARAIEELEKFFEATDALETKKLKFQGWRGPAKAIKTIKKLAL